MSHSVLNERVLPAGRITTRAWYYWGEESKKSSGVQIWRDDSVGSVPLLCTGEPERWCAYYFSLGTLAADLENTATLQRQSQQPH